MANLAWVHTKTFCQIALAHMSAQSTDDNYVTLGQLGLDTLPCVGGMRHNLKMGGIHTGAMPATNPAQAIRLRMTEVVKFTPRRDWADQTLVSPSVCEVRALAASRLRVPSITVEKTAGCPFPARAEAGTMSGDRADPNLRPELWEQSFVTEGGNDKLSLHRKAPFGAMQPEVIGLAAALIISCA